MLARSKHTPLSTKIFPCYDDVQTGRMETVKEKHSPCAYLR